MIRLSEKDVLLFQGDSITHGGRGGDPNHDLGHGYQYILATRLGLENFDTHPAIYNRAVSGDTVAKLWARWEEDALLLRPTVLSLLIGVNDNLVRLSNGIGPDAALYEKRYRALVDYTREKCPGVKLILGQPFYRYNPLTQKPVREEEDPNAAAIRAYAEASERIAKETGAVYVPFGDVLGEYIRRSSVERILWDGIHPTYVAHEIMARLWYDTVEKSGILS